MGAKLAYPDKLCMNLLGRRGHRLHASAYDLQALELGEVRFAAGARVRAGWAAADARIIPEERA